MVITVRECFISPAATQLVIVRTRVRGLTDTITETCVDPSSVSVACPVEEVFLISLGCPVGDLNAALHNIIASVPALAGR